MSTAARKELELLLRTWRAEAAQRSSARTGRANPEAEQLSILLDSVAYQVGRALVDGLRSPRDLLRLPSEFYRIARRWRAARRTHAPKLVLKRDDAACQQDGLHVRPRPLTAEMELSREVPDDLRMVRIALVADRFTTECIAPDSRVVSLRPDGWLEQIESFVPHLLFVESAWQGLEGEWQGRVSGADAVLRDLVDECRRRGIPAVFWNKEDPLHFEGFIRTAALFDIVCTTDFDSIARYKRELGHERVHLLPFFLQPKLHNPVRSSGERQRASFFAGAWYGNLSQRCMDFCDLADALALAGEFHIYDRNAGAESVARRYPQRYQDCQRGAIEYARTADLYRSYTIGLTINTVKASPTMFARRALELMGSGTSVYSNYCQAMARMFGDLAVVSDDGEYVLKQAYEELRNPHAPEYRIRRMKALRKVLREHTWQERLQWLVRLTHGKSMEMPNQAVVVLAHVVGQRQADALGAMLAVQKIEVICRVWAAADVLLPEGVRRLTDAELQGCLSAVAGALHVAVWNLEDSYGEDYLSDLVLSLRFGVADAVSKACRSDDQASCSSEYTLMVRIPVERSLFPASIWSGSVKSLLEMRREGSIEAEECLCIDGSSYRRHGAAARDKNESDGDQLDEGLSIAVIREISDALPPSPAYPSDCTSGAALAKLFPQAILPFGVSMVPRRHRLEIVSKLGADSSVAVSSRPFSLASSSGQRGVQTYCLDAPGHAGMDFHLRSTDGAGRVVTSTALPPNTNRRLPKHAAKTGLLQVEIRGSGVTHVDALWHSERPAEAPMLCGGGRLLLVTNGYPGEGGLYRNAFIHGRVLRYRALGIKVDVVWLSMTERPRTYEHEGVTVIVCSHSALKAGLARTRYDAIAAHFLDSDMWDAIAEAAKEVRTVVWLHGAEIQSWERRLCNFTTAEERAAARMASERRAGFWRELLKRIPENLHLVFVSKQFALETQQDLGVSIPDGQWSVIHNPIDTHLFSYHPKSPDQRFRIVSVRPHDYRIYANDVVAAAIRTLAGEPFFDQLHFTLVGDGALLKENFKGLEAYSNVVIERRFLTRQELASLYRSSGIMLIPTRGDTHGVSRDEAMASGVVPVTTDAGAVTEFVDALSAMIVPVDDGAALAAGVKALVHDEVRFLTMSQAAAMRVRHQSDARLIVRQELSVLALKERN